MNLTTTLCQTQLPNIFRFFVIALLVEWEKDRQLRLTELYFVNDMFVLNIWYKQSHFKLPIIKVKDITCTKYLPKYGQNAVLCNSDWLSGFNATCVCFDAKTSMIWTWNVFSSFQACTRRPASHQLRHCTLNSTIRMCSKLSSEQIF